MIGIGLTISLRSDIITSGEPTTTDFVFTMRVAALETITLPATGTNNFLVDWGDGSSEQVTTVNPTHEYIDAGDYEIRLDGTCTEWSFNNGGSKLNLISVSNLGVMEWTSLVGAFYGCSNAVSIVSGNTDTSAITSMSVFAFACSSMTNLDLTTFDMGEVTTFADAFGNCSSLTEIDTANWDLSSAVSLFTIFANCSSLVSFDAFNWDLVNNKNTNNSFLTCPLDTETQDGILFAVVAGGYEPVIALALDLTGGVEVPSAAGLADKDILVGRNWIVTVNT
jgi:surface protein